MYYEQIQGWFDFNDIYDSAVEHADPNNPNIFVEIGCWKGKSFCYLCEKILESGKNIRVCAIDTWLGTEGAQTVLASERGGHEYIYQEFLDHRDAGGFESFTEVIRKPSLEAVKDFDDNSLDFVFIDAFHAYDSVRADILAWLPKVKKTGMIGGHDFNSAGVERAVREIFGTNFGVTGVSWLKIMK